MLVPSNAAIIVQRLSWDDVRLSTFTEPSLMNGGVNCQGFVYCPRLNVRKVVFQADQTYRKAKRIPPVTEATTINSRIIECGPYSLLSSSAVFTKPSRFNPALKVPDSAKSGSGLLGILSPLRNSPAMVA